MWKDLSIFVLNGVVGFSFIIEFVMDLYVSFFIKLEVFNWFRLYVVLNFLNKLVFWNQ